MFGYYFHRISSWVTFAIVLVVFLVGLQVVGWIRRDILGYGPQMVVQQPIQQPAAAPAAGIMPPASQPHPASTTPAQNPAPAVPAGPSLAEIRQQLQDARDRLVESTVHVDKALQSISDWDAEILPLLKTSVGDKIAAQEDLLTGLTKIVSEERTTAVTIREKAKRIAALRSELGKRATSSTPKPLSAQETAEIDELETMVRGADEQWTNALSNARAIKVLADARIEPEKKRTLKEEIDVKAAEEKLAEFEEQQRQEEIRKAQKAEEKRKQERLAAERRREQEELETQRKKEAEAAEAEQRRKEAELLAQARSSEVQATLAPFLHPRGVQPEKVGGGSIRFSATFEERPMSLLALKNIGALEPSTEGLKWLARVGGNRKLSGPRWGIYSQPNNWSEADKKLLQEAQQFLREFGPILVKDGKLSP